MKTYRLPGAFRPSPGGLFRGVTDGVVLSNTPFTSQRSPGATQIDTIRPTQQINQRWVLQSLSVLGYLGIASLQGAPVNVPYGRLGRIIAGILLPTNPIPTTGLSSNIFWTTPMLELPDPSLTVEIWNPASDPLPPLFDGGPIPEKPSALLPINGLLQLTNPIELAPGESVGVGIWITPSLIGSSGIAANQQWLIGLSSKTSYVVTYDENF